MSVEFIANNIMGKKLINQQRRGFTLIELLVVISIIGLLSSVVFASLNKARARSRDLNKIQKLVQIRNALEIYYSANRSYPKTFTNPGDTTKAIDGSCTMGTASLTVVNPPIPGDVNNIYVSPNDWIPGLVSSGAIANLPAIGHLYLGNTNYADCYFYMSDGTDYKLSNVNALELMCSDNTGQFCTNGILGPEFPYSATINTPGASSWLISDEVLF